MKKPFGVVAAFAMLVAGCAALFATLLLATRYWRVATTPEGVILTFEVDRDSLVDDQPVDMQAMVTVPSSSTLDMMSSFWRSRRMRIEVRRSIKRWVSC